MPAKAPDLDRLRAAWRTFAENECGDYTPLYRQICEAVAADDEALELTAQGPPHARQPNMLLAAVHFLVIRTPPGDPELDRLRSIYDGAATNDQPADNEPGAAFLSVVHANRARLAELLATRYTQTNECGRVAPLALALESIAADHRRRSGTEKGLALIDAGCSAGLNLAVDRYRIEFDSHPPVGPADGVAVRSELRGPHPGAVLPLPSAVDSIDWRVGLERAPVNLVDDDAVDWLVACVWPDHRERRQRANAALSELARHPPTIVRGDMVDDLEALIDQAPDGSLVTVLTSWAAAYLQPVDRKRLAAVLLEASHRRPIVWLSMEAPGVVEGLTPPDFIVESQTSPSLVGFIRYERGTVEATTLGWTHPHGSWFAPTASQR